MTKKIDIKNAFEELRKSIAKEPDETKAKRVEARGKKAIFAQAQNIMHMALVKKDYVMAREFLDDLEKYFPRDYSDVCKELQEIVLWEDIVENFKSCAGHRHLYYVVAAKKLYPEQELLPIDSAKEIEAYNLFKRVGHLHSCDMPKIIKEKYEKPDWSFPSYAYPRRLLHCFTHDISDLHDILLISPDQYVRNSHITPQYRENLTLLIKDVEDHLIEQLPAPPEKGIINCCKNLLKLYADASFLDDVKPSLPNLSLRFWDAVRQRVEQTNNDENNEQSQLEVSISLYILASLANASKPAGIPDFVLSKNSWELAKAYLDFSKAIYTFGGTLTWATELLRTKIDENISIQQQAN